MERLQSTGFWIGPIDTILSGDRAAAVAAAARWLQRRSHAAAR